MFRNRLNSQKPDGKLLEDFKASFPHLQQRSHSLAGPAGHTLADALDVAHPSRPGDTHDDIKDQDPTPRGNAEPWRFTPSLLDPNSFAFTSFANQPPGYYTPTPGGTNTLYHSQAGDLHTPGFSFGLGTPLSLPTSEGGVHAGQLAPSTHLHGFNHHALGTHHFQNVNPFGMQPQHSQSFAPHQFTHQPSAFDQGPMAQPHDDSPMDNLVPEVEMQEQSPLMTFASHSYDDNMAPTVAPPPPPPNQNFRYHVTLNAPTAMVKQPDEVPVTYLNKGQAYSISLVDTAPLQGPIPTKYRTFIRISFEDEQQRQRPASCWQLWKEGRGTNEAHQRGGRLQAVEFVDPSQVGGGEIQGRPRVELESSSFDGFVVTWTPVQHASAECSLAVRFNFLSTDFSHSKGVKGIPVRLCAKTEMVTEATGSTALKKLDAELCYCKVKLFRDHGAERKLSNDVAHVKKTIDKLKQQIAQVESGMKDFGKRKRSGSISKSNINQRPGKVPKHKRTWSMTSASELQGSRAPAEEDLHIKLASLQDMFSSTRPVSVLYLKGEEQDDPDIHPVILGATPQELSKLDTNIDAPMWETQESGTAASSVVSPTPSSQSLHSEKRRTSSFQRPAPFQPPSRMTSSEWRSLPQTATGDLKGMVGIQGGADVPTKVQRPYSDDHALSGWIEALGVDQTYQPPPEPMLKPVACFFVQPRLAGRQPEDNYYRAVYVMSRTVKELVAAIAMKINMEPTTVTRTIRVNQKGLQILMDDDAVSRIPEQQDMSAEFYEVGTPPVHSIKHEWDAGSKEIQVDGDISVTENVHSTGYELRLLF
ncbi:hypothetical protein Ptr902_05549 [Pyrenophora tritici-repentis]|nr:hypothetical protein Ptr902_05549 [Pyrenophora tritici-repentis]